jgi:hypothetical protein
MLEGDGPRVAGSQMTAGKGKVVRCSTASLARCRHSDKRRWSDAQSTNGGQLAFSLL